MVKDTIFVFEYDLANCKNVVKKNHLFTNRFKLTSDLLLKKSSKLKITVMKKKMFIALFLLATSFQFLFAQIGTDANNYLTTSISYSFYGTGDISGNALGISYTRMVADRFGFQVGYSKATGQSEGLLEFDNLQGNQEPPYWNIRLEGDKTFAFDMANYHSYNAGIAYRVTDGDKSTLLVAAGANFKRVRYNYINQTFPIRESGSDRELIMIGSNFSSRSSLGFHVTLDYLFFVADDFSIGIHGSFENTEDVLTNGGISIGYRF